MIPLDVLDADDAALAHLAVDVRGALDEAATALERAQRFEREARALPPTGTTADTVRLLTERRRLCERRVDLYRRTLAVLEHGAATS